jgi:hypothetical protein
VRGNGRAILVPLSVSAPSPSIRIRGALVFALALTVYLVNNRVLAEIDCVAAPYTAWSMIRHGSIDVSRYAELARFVENRALWVTADGQWVSIRPLGSALAALPFVAPLAVARPQPLSFEGMLYLGKIVAAVSVALAAALFFGLCERAAPDAAVPATLLFAFGSCLWTVASQALWTHGPATLGVTAALASLFPASRGVHTWRRSAAAAAGFAFAFLCRETTIVFAAAASVALLLTGRRREALAITAAVLAVVIFTVGYNAQVFGHPLLGGYANDAWNQRAPLIGIAGLLVAPSRGVLVYSPALLLSIAGSVFARPDDRADRALLISLGGAVLITIAMYGSWYDWRGGWSYGPRFLTETMPVACLSFALAYSALRGRGRRLAEALIAISIGVQVVGITGYAAHAPWHQRHELDDQGRSLFSIRDTEIEAHVRAALAHLRGRF